MCYADPILTESNDDGYNSPSGQSSPSKSHQDHGCEPDRSVERLIARDTRDFKAKYFIEKVILNSANGIIYQGRTESSSLRTDRKTFVFSLGHRKIDGKPICAKQVPKAKIANWDDHDGRRIPREFKLHMMASQVDGVVKVLIYQVFSL